MKEMQVRQELISAKKTSLLSNCNRAHTARETVQLLTLQS